MAHRIIAQVIVVGTQVVGKAFVEAYRQAAANSARQSTAQAGKTAVQNNITRQTGITVEEAHQILNVKKGETDLEAIQKKYQAIMEANDPQKGGGSFYLQSKAYRAFERIEMELAEVAKAEKAPGKAPEDKGSSV